MKKQLVFLLPLCFFFTVTIIAQNVLPPPPLTLSAQQLKKFQRQGIDLTAYDFRNPEYNLLIKESQRHSRIGNTTLGIGIGVTITSLALILSKNSTPPCQTCYFDNFPTNQQIWGAAGACIAIPLFIVSGAQTHKYTKKVKLLRSTFPLIVPK